MPDEATHDVTETEVPLTLLRQEGQQMAERWLAEARVARDRVRLALPPSTMALGAGMWWRWARVEPCTGSTGSRRQDARCRGGTGRAGGLSAA